MLLPAVISFIVYAVFLQEANGHAAERADSRKPIWDIAHMVNDLGLVDEYLGDGANGLELDVAFTADGTADKMYHGVPCDCFRSCTRTEGFTKYMDYIRQLTTPGNSKFKSQLILLIMDLKLNGIEPNVAYAAGKSVAEKLLSGYWQNGKSGARAYIVLSLETITRPNFISGFRDAIKASGHEELFEKIGWDFSGNEDLGEIRRVYQKYGIEDHIWQGDGITNCLPRGDYRLTEAMKKKNDPNYKYTLKVYTWSIDKESSIRNALRLGVDAVMTNYPARVKSILRESEFSGTHRMATYDDNPWQK
uniref:Dermonecrotic toxin LiSicTox-betaIA1i n=1 Tax=Loxosceles intermedia TaxID=58218 RepID=B1H1_LOXIN|nr:RecName: Full=Dermonecrotic toxin LiSicTox-betaIA1i; AltName: Full=Dermonecrotic toxin 3; Short=DT3; AltName: Full=Dermonecrotic toxin-like I; AltName: Full=LiRecDT3; AltName: Full=Loxtox i6; AltName: Full=P3; AltName: Full=Phospholipase D; Short=PLD; AltName: Full=Sphingomyelin phosphodiesterase D 3; Short=SMD 3; Short=Smase D 3; Short=Sphingomyelinase D 3; Flags: Precursor [Loxosceles intermedia]ABB71184.1 dermonecrotic toxin isoform 3 [Loxosceles intermedia]